MFALATMAGAVKKPGAASHSKKPAQPKPKTQPKKIDPKQVRKPALKEPKASPVVEQKGRKNHGKVKAEELKALVLATAQKSVEGSKKTAVPAKASAKTEEKPEKKKEKKNPVKPTPTLSPPALEDGRVTPPARRVPSKSPQSTVSAPSSSGQDRAMQALRMEEGLQNALTLATARAELNAAGMDHYLEALTADSPSALAGNELARRMTAKQESGKAQEIEDDGEDSAEKSDDEEGVVDQAEASEVENEDEGDEGDEDDDDADDQEAGEEEEEEQDEEVSPMAEAAPEDEGEEEQAGKTEKPASPAANSSADEQLALASAKTNETAEDLKRNSVTMKKDWDQYNRSVKSGNFPATLNSYYKKNKQSLFGLWLDSAKNWDKVVLCVESTQKQENLARSEWCAVQVKELRTKFTDPQKLTDLLQKRHEQGLYYKDPDFPDDEEDWGLKPQKPNT